MFLEAAYGFLLSVLGDVDALPDIFQPVGFFEFFEYDGGLEAVGGVCRELDALVLGTGARNGKHTSGEELDA
jgi:hypothetical protein